MPLSPRSRPVLSFLTAVAVLVGPSLVVPATAVGPSESGSVAAVVDPGDVWTPVRERPQARRDGLRQRVAPASYAGYHLDLPALADRLDQAPLESEAAEPLVVSVPAPTGELVEFAVTESPVMEAGLAALHPDITTYAGRTTGAAPASIRLDVTPMGFHASVRGSGATWFVDPAYQGADQGPDALYLSYDGASLPDRDQRLVEPEMGEVAGLAEAARRTAARVADAPRVGEGQGAVAIQRTYRLALATDPSYAAFFGTTSDAVVTAEKVTLMNRVNQVYGDDLSVRMLLVAGNDLLNFNTPAQFTGANGRCGNVACYVAPDDVGCGGVIDTNRFVLGQVIGADRFDIGHIMFGADGAGGGVAYLGAVGTTVKAGGCTGLSPPTGDGFAVDYVAHEMGHQFAGNHTFDGTSGNCSGANRNRGTSVEPGSGVTIMAYAGICGVDNLQRHSDPYFSQRSQSEIAAFTRSAPGNVQEVQNVALSGFTTAGESFTVSYGGVAPSVTVGTSYTAAGLKAALEAAEPSAATATVVGSRGTSFGTGANGFQVTWSGTTDIATPTITPTSGSFTSIVGTFDNGGPETNRGFQNPAPTGNRNPTVTAPAARTIPQRTPFALTGSATDPDGDALVYTWEQNDPGSVLGGTALNSNTRLSGPLFRVFGTYADVTPAGTQQYDSPGLNLATSSPTRSFPDAAQVAAGETNAATGSCPAYGGDGSSDSAALRCFSEFLPVQPVGTRALGFRLTARDLGGSDGGPDGGVSSADTTLTVGTAGPFLVTSQASAGTVTGATSGTVAWDVAGTGNATYATAVRVTFSTDGGLTFPLVVSASTPNDGSETISWPNVATTEGRVKVEALDNYFYDVNDADLTVTPSAVTPTLTTGGNATDATFTAASSDALTAVPEITAESNTVAGSALTASLALPPGLAGLVITRTVTTSGGATFQVSGTADADPDTYPVTATVSDGAGNAADQVVGFAVTVVKDDATLTYAGDTSGSTGTRTVSVTVADTDATPGTPAGTVAFTDQATGDVLCNAPVASGSATCTFSATASRTYQVVGTLSGTRYAGASAPAALVVTDIPVDTTPPDTTITAGPGQGSIQLARTLTFRFAAEPGATYQCFLGSAAAACDGGVVSLRSLASGSYDFRVAATDTAGNTDPTPAARRFYVPVNDRQLRVARGPWTRATSAATYRGTYSTARRKGATLTHRVTGATSLALVLSNGRALGRVDVFLGRTRLATLSGRGAPRTQRIAAIRTFPRPTSGLVRIVARSRAPVRIEGLAVRTAAVTTRPAGRLDLSRHLW